MKKDSFSAAFAAAARRIGKRGTMTGRISPQREPGAQKNAAINARIRAQCQNSDIVEEMRRSAEQKAAKTLMEKHGLDVTLADQVAQDVLARRGGNV